MTERARAYAVIYTPTETGWSAHVPDVSGLGVAGATFEETEQLMRDGLAFHLEALSGAGLAIPDVRTRVMTVRVTR